MESGGEERSSPTVNAAEVLVPRARSHKLKSIDKENIHFEQETSYRRERKDRRDNDDVASKAPPNHSRRSL